LTSNTRGEELRSGTPNDAFVSNGTGGEKDLETYVCSLASDASLSAVMSFRTTLSLAEQPYTREDNTRLVTFPDQLVTFPD